MAGRIPQQFIQDLIARVDIVSLIDERVHLKKTGQNYSACCPFHNEKTPSFTVSPEKQFYHCFGCGAHGSAIGFLMEYDRLDFVSAVEQLAARAGVEVPREAGAHSPADELQPVYAMLTEASQFFEAQLREPAGQIAVEYLKRRGLTGAIAKEYGIGYAPRGWDNLLQHSGRDPERRKAMARAGLLIEKDGGGFYDRFRHRVVFVIRDTRGRAIGFGGRVIDDEQPKYLNSPETPVFHKGRELYGLYEAQKRTRKLTQLLVVEGYMDVVGLAQYGVGNAVATLGTATTKEHIEKLFRVTDDVVFCFDGDNAGRQAAWRALEAALPLMTGQHQVRFMFLPEGEDPDTLIRKEGREAFDARIVTSIPLSGYLFEQLCAQADLSSIDGRARLVELARPLLSKVPSEVYRQMLMTRLAEIARIDAGQLTRLLQPKAASHAAPAPKPNIVSTSAFAPSALRTAVRLLILQPALALGRFDRAVLPPGDRRADLLTKLVELVRANPKLTSGMLFENFRDTPEGDYLDKVARWNWTPPEQGLEVEWEGVMVQLGAQCTEARTQELLEKAATTPLSDDEKSELKRLLADKNPAAEAHPISARRSH